VRWTRRPQNWLEALSLQQTSICEISDHGVCAKKTSGGQGSRPRELAPSSSTRPREWPREQYETPPEPRRRNEVLATTPIETPAVAALASDQSSSGTFLGAKPASNQSLPVPESEKASHTASSTKQGKLPEPNSKTDKSQGLSVSLKETLMASLIRESFSWTTGSEACAG
jgi:hypothetical protein